MTQPSLSKAQFRARLKGAVAALTREEKRLFSQAICQSMETLEPWRQSVSVLGYVPQPDEPDIGPLLARALELGKTLALPSYDQPTREYGARQVRDLERDLAPGEFGILEPTKQCPMLSLNQLDLVLVPGVGFSSLGCRIGRGNGFYDRLLGQIAGLKCGVAFDGQVETGLPMEPHDVSMNCIITPTRWLLCQGDGGPR